MHNSAQPVAPIQLPNLFGIGVRTERAQPPEIIIDRVKAELTPAEATNMAAWLLAKAAKVDPAMREKFELAQQMMGSGL